MRTLHHHRGVKGFTAAGVLIALTILGVMASSVVVLVANNQAARTAQINNMQAFYTSQAAFEFAMRQIMAGGNPNPMPSPTFLGTSFNITRTCNKINVDITTGSATKKFSIDDPGQLCAIEGSATPSSNSAPFNGQSIPQGRYIWFNLVFTVAGLTSTVTHVYLEQSSVLFSANGVNYNVVTPSAIVTFDPAETCVSTVYEAGQWHTTVPTDQQSDIFVTAVGFPVPVDLPGSISPVTWTATFAADQPGLSTHWQWGAATYTASLSDLSALGVKASDKNTCGDGSNDKAATPVNVKSYLTNGARSAGGSNYTGGGSGTQGTVVQCLSGCE